MVKPDLLAAEAAVKILKKEELLLRQILVFL
jgi:hypothetical protein